MTRSFFALLVLAACHSGGSHEGETGLDVGATDVSDRNPDTDVDSDIDTDPGSDTDLRDTFTAGSDTAIESDSDRPDTDVADTDTDVVTDPDHDGDGYPASNDCNDNDSSVHPGATEVCNGHDDNCVGGVDEGTNDGVTYHRDQDGDTYGSTSVTTRACGVPVGYVADGTDCDDSAGAVHPGAVEVCNSIDDDCAGGVDDNATDVSTFYEDHDGDHYGNAAVTVVTCFVPSGYTTEHTDCDDTRIAVHPGAVETCNGIDDNCVGGIDEGVQNTYYADADFDGYGDATTTQAACAPSAGWVADATDCDDEVDTTHPNATEVCNGVDDNCVGGIDEGVKSTFYLDDDQDGFGDATKTVISCTAPQGYVTTSTDCNDGADYIHPGAPETDCADPTDYNCDGATGYADADVDGTPACEDCDDNDSSVHPGATEVCNGHDDNCVGGIDEGLTTVFYADGDGDGYGNLLSTVNACTQPVGYAANSTDCDDTRSSVHPAAVEVCNGRDDNCVGGIDEGVKTTFYEDGDDDSYGSASTHVDACTAPEGYVAIGTDCDDTRAAVNPGAVEVCNGIDDNCVGGIDEGVKSTFYADVDNDHYGDAAVSTQACSVPSGFAADSTDCDDDNANVHPLATEVCNGIDDNCAAGIDEGVKLTYYRDADSDTYGDGASTTLACTLPEGYAADSSDCNDHASSVHPNAVEVCNGIDDNCVGGIDEGVKSTFYADVDHDTYGNASVTTQACTPPEDYVADHGDCNDASSSVHPGATETCNGVDDNCNGGIDEGVKSTFFADTDSDTYGDVSSSVQACTAPSGFVSNSTDCDDTKVAIHPGATEVCNGIDDNCAGGIDEGVKITFYLDADSDTYGNAALSTLACAQPSGYVPDGNDCDDANNAVHPNATEVCNGIDDNCAGGVDEGVTSTFYADTDHDGFGSPSSTTQACTVPSNFVANSTDCNDAASSVHPGATETCNGVDDDCDLTADNHLGTAPLATKQAGVCNGSRKVCTGSFGYQDPDYTAIPLYQANETLCDGNDNDCDALTDENLKVTYYQDLDHDGYGVNASAQQACTQPEGFVAAGNDCKDSDKYVYPGAVELCDLQKNDCSAVSWTPAQEAGKVSLQSTTGAWTDITSSFTGAFTLPTGTVHVCDGDYDVSLSAAPSGATTVVGTSIDTVSLTGAETHRVLTMASGDVTFQDLGVDSGHAVGDGGCILVSGGTLHLNRVDVHDCTATGNGGGLRVASGATASVDSSDLTFGVATGVGGCLSSSGSLSVLNTAVANCLADGDGGGIHADAGTFDLTGSSVDTCTAQSGAGVALRGTVSATLTGIGMDNNVASVDGGGLFADTSNPLDLSLSTLTQNSADGRGGNLFLADGTCDMANVAIGAGTATGDGGGAYLSMEALTMTDGTSFHTNTSSASGGALYMTGGSLDDEGTDFLDNSAIGEGVSGGALFLTDLEANFTDTTFEGNQAAAIALAPTTSEHGGTIAIDGAYVSLTEALITGGLSGKGGAIWMSASESLGLEMFGTTSITGNSALFGGGLYVDSGRASCGVSGTDAPSLISNTTTAPNAGAGVFLNGVASDLTLFQCDMGADAGLRDNTATGATSQDVTTGVGTSGFGAGSIGVCNGATGCGGGP